MKNKKATQKPKGKGGRKDSFDFKDKDNLIMIEEMAREGLDDKHIAQKLRYSAGWFCELKAKHPELVEALKKGRRPLNYYVETSLFKKATGLKTKTITTRQIKDKDTGIVTAEEVTTIETEHAPDTGAIAFWLKQRKPEVWNKQPTKIAETDAEGNNKDEIKVTLSI